jgi:hypothetical protein
LILVNVDITFKFSSGKVNVEGPLTIIYKTISARVNEETHRKFYEKCKGLKTKPNRAVKTFIEEYIKDCKVEGKLEPERGFEPQAGTEGAGTDAGESQKHDQGSHGEHDRGDSETPAATGKPTFRIRIREDSGEAIKLRAPVIKIIQG